MLEIYSQRLTAWQERIDNGETNIKLLWRDFPASLLETRTEAALAGVTNELVFNRPLRATITGTTREQLESALHDIKELWLNRTRVTTVIGEATALYNLAREATALTRYRHPELEPATVAHKLESLLNDSSVPLPAMKVDKSARTLSSASAVGRSCTPEEYWAAMEEAYTTLNDLIVRQIQPVFARWTRPLIESTKALEDLTKLAGELGESPASLPAVAAEIEAWRAKVFDDPLLAVNLVDPAPGITQAIKTTSSQLQALKAKRATFAPDLAAAKIRLAGLTTLRDSLREAYTEAASKIVAPLLVAPDDQSVVEDFAERLGNIEAAAPQQPKPAARALALWNEQVGGYEQYLRQSLATNRQPLCQRDEMRSEYGAHAIVAQRFKNNPTVTQHAADVKAVLWTRPIDLAQARQALTEFEQLIARMIQ